MTRRGGLSHHETPEALLFVKTGNKNHYGPGTVNRLRERSLSGILMVRLWLEDRSQLPLHSTAIGSLLNMTCIYWQGSWELSLAIEKS